VVLTAWEELETGFVTKMHPFRIAILVFVVGASVANYFFTKEQHDEISPLSVAAPAGATLQERYGATAMPSVSSSQPGSYTARLESAAKEKAWMREAIIVTIAGVAWFLVRPKATS
jgi:hypothetical protein